jgi:hypothetical protein
MDEPTIDDLTDAIIEDTCHCDFCGGPFVLGNGHDHVILDLPAEMPGLGSRKLGPQLKLCIECAALVVKEYERICRDAGVCSHGVAEGEYCEDCNREYKRARQENGID